MFLVFWRGTGQGLAGDETFGFEAEQFLCAPQCGPLWADWGVAIAGYLGQNYYYNALEIRVSTLEKVRDSNSDFCILGGKKGGDGGRK